MYQELGYNLTKASEGPSEKDYNLLGKKNTCSRLGSVGPLNDTPAGSPGTSPSFSLLSTHTLGMDPLAEERGMKILNASRA
jgi:hypothetical protein